MTLETMTSERPSTLLSAATGWEHLFSLAKREADDCQVLRGELERWCSARRADAAIYVEIDGTLKRLLAVGRTAFPDPLPPTGPDASWTFLELPHTLLVHTAGPDTPEPREALLLAAGARISSLKRQIQEQTFQAKFRGVELEALYDVGLAIASTLDLEELCEEALLRAVSLLDARRGALYLHDGEGYRLTSRFGGSALEVLPASQADVASLLAGDCAAASGWLPGARHLLSVPVETEGAARGVLIVADKESRYGVGPFPETDRRTLLLFANQAAIALENAKLHRLALEKERLEREMELAAEIQQQLLPESMPAVAGYEVLGWNRPARQAGGDYFDFQTLSDGGLGLVLGDVVGKGLPAALLVSTLHSALRVLLDQMEVGPALVERLNRHIHESSSANKFITLVLAALELESGRLSYLNAGHNPGIVVRAGGGEILHMASSGLPLGLMSRGRFGLSSLELGRGDLVCLYSDGITECAAPDDEEFSFERLVDLLVDGRRQPLAELLERIDRSVTDFAQGLPQGDDQTVILLRRS